MTHSASLSLIVVSVALGEIGRDAKRRPYLHKFLLKEIMGNCSELNFISLMGNTITFPLLSALR